MARLTTCPDCRAEISPGAGPCPKCGKPNGLRRRFGWLKAGIWAFFLCAVATALVRNRAEHPAPASPPAPPLAPASEAPRPIRAGEAATIMAPGAWIAREGAWDAMLAAEEARNTELLVAMNRAGRVVFQRGGARVFVVEAGVASVKVRVAGGLYEGFEGWIQRELVAAEPSPGP